MRLHAWKAFAAWGVIAGGLFLVAPTGATEDLLWHGLAWSAVAGAHVALRLHRPVSATGWRFVVAALWLFAVGAAPEMSTFSLAPGHPLMIAGDVVHLVAAMLTGMGSLAFVCALVPGGARDALVDGAIVLTALATVLWGVLFDVSALAARAEPAQHAVLVIFSLMPAWVMAMVLRVLMVTRWRVRSAALLCGAGVAALMAAVSTVLTMQHGGASGNAQSLLWLTVFVCVGTAALHPSMRGLTEPLADLDASVMYARVSALGLALLAPPIALFVAAGHRLDVAVLAAAGLSVAIGWRFRSIVAEREEARRGVDLRAERQAHLASLAELALTGPPLPQMGAAVVSAVEGQIPGVTCRVRLDEEGDEDERAYLRIPVVGSQGDLGRLLLAVRRVLTEEEVRYARTVASILAGLIDRQRMDAAMRRRALHDELTGLPNRALLMDRLRHALERGRRQSASVALVFVDLDGFKEVNDTLGHNAGDALLQLVAARLERGIRAADTLARFAGDEFVIVVEDASDDEVRALAARVGQALREPFSIADAEVPVSASIGVAYADEDVIDADVLLRHGDWAMYRAKQLGRDRVVEFDAPLRDALARRQLIEQELRHAAQAGQLRLVYQPFVALDRERPEAPTDVVVAAEALLRWDHPELGPVSPAEFVPVAEATGMIVGVGEWVLQRACADLRAWRAALPATSPFSVFVNMSPIQLSDPLLVARLDRCLAATGADPTHLGVEITESAVLDDDDQVSSGLEALRRRGVSIALDDFGTGYSSLAHLRRVPLDLLKVDASFVGGVGLRQHDRAIVSAVSALAREIGVQVLAEGVEQPEQLEAVRALGCDLVQGYLMARPMPAEELTAMLGLDPAVAPARSSVR